MDMDRGCSHCRCDVMGRIGGELFAKLILFAEADPVNQSIDRGWTGGNTKLVCFSPPERVPSAESDGQCCSPMSLRQGPKVGHPRGQAGGHQSSRGDTLRLARSAWRARPREREFRGFWSQTMQAMVENSRPKMMHHFDSRTGSGHANAFFVPVRFQNPRSLGE